MLVPMQGIAMEDNNSYKTVELDINCQFLSNITPNDTYDSQPPQLHTRCFWEEIKKLEEKNELLKLQISDEKKAKTKAETELLFSQLDIEKMEKLKNRLADTEKYNETLIIELNEFEEDFHALLQNSKEMKHVNVQTEKLHP
jgi:hypothetical protein